MSKIEINTCAVLSKIEEILLETCSGPVVSLKSKLCTYQHTGGYEIYRNIYSEQLLIFDLFLT